MAEANRPVHGYPIPTSNHPVNGYPLPTSNQPGPPPNAAYPYPQPPQFGSTAYYPPQAQPNSRNILIHRMITGGIIIIGLFLFIFFLFFLIVRPRPPKYHIINLSIQNFSVSKSSQKISGVWNLTFRVHNPNKKIKLSFTETGASIFYRSDRLSQTRLPPFFLDPQNGKEMPAELSSTDYYVDKSTADGLSNDVAHGSVSFDVRFLDIVRFELLSLRPRRRLVNVLCKSNIVAISKGSGHIKGAPKQCKVISG